MEFTRMQLRSSISKEEREIIATKKQEEEAKKKKAKLNRPTISYKGQVKYVTTLIDCAIVCDELLKLVNESKDEAFMVGFDLEWSFNYQTGPEKAAVIQISPNLDVCYVLHVSQLKNLPKGLSEFLHHPKVHVTGVNVKNDIRKLARDFTGFDGDKIVENCIDSGLLANTILSRKQRWSMEKLVDRVLNMKINKDKKIRNSKWHVIPLTVPQQKYAATDAYASLLLYIKLKEMEKQLDKEQDTNAMNIDQNILIHFNKLPT